MPLFSDSLEDFAQKVRARVNHVDRTLALEGEHIGAAEADFITTFDALHRIHLSGGTIDDKALHILAGADIRILHVKNNAIGPNGARILSRNTNLVELDISGNPIGEEGAEYIAAVKNLRKLIASRTGVGAKGLDAFASLPHLYRLELDGNPLDGGSFLAIARMKQLRVLSLNACNLGDDPDILQILGDIKLERLFLTDNALDDSALLHLSRLPSLRQLGASRNQIQSIQTDPEIEHRNPLWLDLSHNPIGDDGLQNLLALVLVEIDLRSTNITEIGIRKLLDGWIREKRNLRYVHFDKVPSVTLPPELLGMHEAVPLLAAYNKIRSSGRKAVLNEAKLLVVGNVTVHG